MAKKDSKAFEVAQQIGKSLFLPISILPFAGVLLGIGASFTNPATIAAYGLEGAIHQGTFLYALLSMCAGAGGAIFGNLPLWFALAVALGLAKHEKGIATLSSGILYFIMLTTIGTLLNLDGSIVDGVVSDTVKAGAISAPFGIQTLEMGVFGGIVAGIIAANLCDKYYQKELPDSLAFFSGTRFVPIICMVYGIITGAVLYFVWPFFQSGIFALGDLVQKTGLFGTFIFGFTERALIPFGLHHIFYIPFWQTGVGGTEVVQGVTVAGAQNIFFAQLADPSCQKFSVDACRFLTGKYPFMMAGLPGAAFAMYKTAKPEKRSVVKSLLISVALTTFLTGITEPIEFTFLFLAPQLYILHCVLAGIAFVLCHALQICVGTTFSDGLIDFVLFGILPGQAKTNWMMMIPLFVAYFFIYYYLFKYYILKFDLKTPGREDDDEEAHLMSKAEYQEKTGVGVAGAAKGAAGSDDEQMAMILEGIGGLDNCELIDCCATRLRLTLKDGTLVNEPLLKKTGAMGVVIKGNGIQVIYGPKVSVIKTKFEEYVEKLRNKE